MNKYLILSFLILTFSHAHARYIKVKGANTSLGYSKHRIIGIEKDRKHIHLIGHDANKSLTILKKSDNYFTWSYLNDYTLGRQMPWKKTSQRHLKKIIQLSLLAENEECEFLLDISSYGEFVGYNTILDCDL